MVLGRRLVGAIVVSVCGGCGSDAVHVAASRYVNSAAAAQSNAAVCFAPPPANMGLADRQGYEEVIGICSAIATQHGVAVAMPGSPNCLLAQIKWSSDSTGRGIASCQPDTFVGRECEVTNTFRKEMTLTLTDPRTGQPVVEARSALKSTSKAVNRRTTMALCWGAFHEHPRPMKNAQIDVELPDDS